MPTYPFNAGERLDADDLNQTLVHRFGNGSDGDAILDGTNTFSWASKASDIYTLTQDVYLNDLTIDSGKTLITAGYILHGRGILTNNGIISNNGFAGGNASSSPGTAGNGGLGTGTLDAGTDGKIGGIRSESTETCTSEFDGVAGTDIVLGLGTDGVAGGDSGGTSSGGVAGTITTADTLLSSYATAHVLTTSEVERQFSLCFHSVNSGTALSPSAGSGSGAGGCGNGGAGGGGHGAGGGSGGGGGILAIVFLTMVNGASGIVQTNGGDGGDGGNGGQPSGSSSGGDGGGGGGGGSGGVVCLAYSSLTNSGTIEASGGTGGTRGTGGPPSTGTAGVDGVDGDDGNAGVVFKIKIT